MSIYTSRVWKARLGTDLNRYLVNNSRYETLVNAPTSITQEGDLLSADNLNDLETRIWYGFNLISNYTYIIDSQAKYEDYLNNVSGNDYTHILIVGGKGAGTNGEYTDPSTSSWFAKSIYLEGRTKTITGVYNPVLQFAYTSIAIYYSTTTSTRPDNINEYYIKNITVKRTSTTDRVSTIFSNCYNIENCKVISNSTTTTSNVKGFSNCINLTNCETKNCTYYYCDNLKSCNATIDTSTSAGGSYVEVYNHCNGLDSCDGTITNASASNSMDQIFTYCYYLRNFKLSKSNMTYRRIFNNCYYLRNIEVTIVNSTQYNHQFYVFSGCYYLTECKIAANFKESADCHGFYSCNYLIDCRSAIANPNYYGRGFSSCKNLILCQGSGTGNSSYWSGGFSDCYCVTQSGPGDHSTSGVFGSCYASHSANSAYAVADTANGGFNNIINPS